MFMLHHSIVDLINGSNQFRIISEEFLISCQLQIFSCYYKQRNIVKHTMIRIQTVTWPVSFCQIKHCTFSYLRYCIHNTYHIRSNINSPEPRKTMGRCPLPVGQKTSIFSERKTVKIIKNKPYLHITVFLTSLLVFPNICSDFSKSFFPEIISNIQPFQRCMLIQCSKGRINLFSLWSKSNYCCKCSAFICF